MTLHLLPLPERKRVKADTKALLNARKETHARLKDELRSETYHAPRHFKYAEYFRKFGETA